ncbi:hypothetical protein MTR_3g084695 [Medicago truncatula]|uniref:Uncharacterized protein n=1 Tax=Medicago truncatula TaxID=3880 RepID=A0A072VAM9_MEDTR|nr:hypothetical protein MTR_3g084695 [Medicago truncatula]
MSTRENCESWGKFLYATLLLNQGIRVEKKALLVHQGLEDALKVHQRRRLEHQTKISGNVKGLYVKGKSDKKGRNGKNKQKSKTTTKKSCYFCHKEGHFRKKLMKTQEERHRLK